MSTPQNNDWLEDALRDGQPYISDDGFTAQVVAVLPRRAHRPWLRVAILGSASLLACVVGLVMLNGAAFVGDCVIQLITARTIQPSLILPALVVTAILSAAFIPVATEK